MANKKISAATDIVTLQDADMLPVERGANATAYHCTIAEMRAAIGAGDFRAGAVEGDVLSMPSTDVDGLEWRFNTFHSDFSAPVGHTDNIVYWGWNMGGSGTQPHNNTRHQWGQAFEAEYWPSADPNDVVSEWYTTFYDVALATERRPLMHTINHATGAVRHFILGNITINDSAGTLSWQFGDGGNLTSQGKSIICNSNNVPFIRQRNAANSGYIDIQLNSANQWSIGAPITMYGDIWFNHSNANGPILIDRTTAAQYRIYVNNGALALEAI
jgi:hypothetical protein